MTNALHHQLNQNVMEGEQQVMSAYEAAFRKIKEATGVADVRRDHDQECLSATFGPMAAGTVFVCSSR